MTSHGLGEDEPVASGGPDAAGAVDSEALGGLPVAEPGQRLVARLIDMLIVGLPVALVAQAVLPRVSAEAAVSVGLGVLLVGYDAVQHALWGRTLGKRLTGVRVVSVPGGGRVPPLQALLRALAFGVPIAVRPVPVLGLLLGAAWVLGVALVLRPDRDRRALHDQLARTAVVAEPG